MTVRGKLIGALRTRGARTGWFYPCLSGALGAYAFTGIPLAVAAKRVVVIALSMLTTWAVLHALMWLDLKSRSGA